MQIRNVAMLLALALLAIPGVSMGAETQATEADIIDSDTEVAESENRLKFSLKTWSGSFGEKWSSDLRGGLTSAGSSTALQLTGEWSRPWFNLRFNVAEVNHEVTAFREKSTHVWNHSALTAGWLGSAVVPGVWEVEADFIVSHAFGADLIVGVGVKQPVLIEGLANPNDSLSGEFHLGWDYYWGCYRRSGQCSSMQVRGGVAFRDTTTNILVRGTYVPQYVVPEPCGPPGISYCDDSPYTALVTTVTDVEYMSKFEPSAFWSLGGSYSPINKLEIEGYHRFESPLAGGTISESAFLPAGDFTRAELGSAWRRVNEDQMLVSGARFAKPGVFPGLSRLGITYWFSDRVGLQGGVWHARGASYLNGPLASARGKTLQIRVRTP